MARELASILSELNNVYDPQRQVVKQQQEAIDPALQAEQKGLEFAKNDAFQNITDSANRRGMFYSGIPLAEQQKYTGSTYLPSLANLQGKYAQQRFNLTDQLNNINLEQRKYGQGIYDQELARDEQIRREQEQQRQFNAQLAAQERAARASGSAGANPSFGFGGSQGPAYGMSKKANGGGFNFVGPDGRPVSAATYAAATGTEFRGLLQQMANQGDAGAKAALGFVGNDYGYNPNKIGGAGNLYNSLVWGTGRQYNAPKSGGGGGVGGW